jgi:hypothetical protein
MYALNLTIYLLYLYVPGSSFCYLRQCSLFPLKKAKYGIDKHLVTLASSTAAVAEKDLQASFYASADLFLDKKLTSNMTSSQKVNRAHTAEAKAKISAANRGKVPWNAGKVHSEETKAKISATTKAAMLKRKADKAAQLGMTLEEYENRNYVVKAEKLKKVGKQRTGLTEEGRKRISESMKRRWEDPEYRAKPRKRVSPSEETREKIRNALKTKWQTNPHPNAGKAVPLSKEARAKISSTLKAKWLEPAYRAKMTQRTHPRTEEWKATVSEKIKGKWAEPQYRQSVVSGLHSYFDAQSKAGPAQPARTSPPKRAVVGVQAERKNKENAHRQARLEAALEKEAWAKAKLACADGSPSVPIREMLGPTLWNAEKVHRHLLCVATRASDGALLL